jgi:putative phosphoribosyl transferase
MGRYADRRQAGRGLASALAECAGKQDLIVLALPGGGVPVAYELLGAAATRAEAA